MDYTLGAIFWALVWALIFGAVAAFVVYLLLSMTNHPLDERKHWAGIAGAVAAFIAIVSMLF